MLHTKSIREVSESDGIKISIMRYNPRGFKYDLWIPSLAPSEKLLKDYNSKKITWAAYERRFKEEIKNADKIVDALVLLAEHRDITLYCYQSSPKECHRRLVAEECKRRNPNLEVRIK